MSWLPPFSRGGAVRAASPADAVEVVAAQAAEDRRVRQRRQRQRRHPLRVGVDQRLLARVPAGQQLRRRRGAHQAGVDDAGERDAGDVPRGRDAPAEVPDHLVRVGELLGEEPAAVLRREHPGVAPPLPGQRPGVLLRDRADVEDVDDEQVAGLGALHGDRAAEHVHPRQRGVEDVLRRVVVVDRAVEPLAAVDPEHVAGAHVDLRGDVGMPAVVADDGLVGELLRRVEREDDLGHATASVRAGHLWPALSSSIPVRKLGGRGDHVKNTGCGPRALRSPSCSERSSSRSTSSCPIATVRVCGSTPSAAARARRSCCCTASRSATSCGTASPRSWRGSTPSSRPTCAATATPTVPRRGPTTPGTRSAPWRPTRSR